MGETSWWAARERASAAVSAGTRESVELVYAVGRTLASDVQALVDLPGFPTAAMDGWVVAGNGPWEIVGTIDTGFPSDRAVADGQAMRIATGGFIPPGASAVIPWEVAQARDGVLTGPIPEKSHIRPQGEECSRGDQLARRGDVLNPALAGALAAAGIDQVEVFIAPRITVLVLGDEVIPAGTPGPGQVRDALGVQLPGWISALGGSCVEVQAVADDERALSAALGTAVDTSDVVVATGGTARGHRDFLRSALHDLSAQFVVDGVEVRPGHPMMLASVRGTPIVGLPGNPLSALVAVVTLVAPIMDSWLGRGGRELPRVLMAESIAPSRKELTRLMVGRRELGGFRQVTHVSSAMLRGIAHADGWAVVPAAGVEAGEAVPWIPLPWSVQGR